MILKSKRGEAVTGIVTALLILVGIVMLFLTTTATLVNSPNLADKIAGIWTDLYEFVSTLNGVLNSLFGQKIGIAIKIFLLFIAGLYVVKLINFFDWG